MYICAYDHACMHTYEHTYTFMKRKCVLTWGYTHTHTHTYYLIFPFSAGVDLIVAFHACLYIGVVPVIIRPPNAQNLSSALPTIKLTLEMSQSMAVLTSSQVVKLLKSKVCVCMFVCVCVYVCVHISVHAHVRICTFSPSNHLSPHSLCACKYTHVYVQYIHMCVCMYIRTCVYACTYVCLHTYTLLSDAPHHPRKLPMLWIRRHSLP